MIVSKEICLLESLLSLKWLPCAANLLRRITNQRRQQMITLNDCKAFCDADPATVARVARHEQLPEIVAIARAHGRHIKARRLQGGPHPVAVVPAGCLPQRLAA
jgi:hypothetical protein